jgi:hypothetical protein
MQIRLQPERALGSSRGRIGWRVCGDDTRNEPRDLLLSTRAEASRSERNQPLYFLEPDSFSLAGLTFKKPGLSPGSMPALFSPVVQLNHFLFRRQPFCCVPFRILCVNRSLWPANP